MGTVDPRSVPAAGVRGATMGINTTLPKTPASLGHSCPQQNWGLPPLPMQGLGCPAGGTACLGQVLSAPLPASAREASWLSALFGDLILFCLLRLAGGGTPGRQQLRAGDGAAGFVAGQEGAVFF